MFSSQTANTYGRLACKHTQVFISWLSRALVFKKINQWEKRKKCCSLALMTPFHDRLSKMHTTILAHYTSTLHLFYCLEERLNQNDGDLWAMQEGSQCWQFSSSGRRLDVGRVIKIPSNFFGIILRKHHFLQKNCHWTQVIHGIALYIVLMKKCTYLLLIMLFFKDNALFEWLEFSSKQTSLQSRKIIKPRRKIIWAT